MPPARASRQPVMREYDQIAEWYTATRNPEIGMADVAAFARKLPPGARVLDIGCGDGVPVSRYLVCEGFEVVAVDSSAEMVARFRANLPGVDARCERIQDAHFAPHSFVGVVAWGVLFHLARADQRATLHNVSRWLKPGGRFLFTSGDENDTREGEMNGVAFHYTSLDVTGYRRSLADTGLRLEDVHRDGWDNVAYLATKET